jgi:coenzyme F420-0:L-glutamate ligase / coenzyme F420-1:gamma-L-glutamate ligase
MSQGDRTAPAGWLPRSARILRRARVARLATADAEGRPHVVPVCFVFDGRAIYIAIDQKPKRVSPRSLRRVRNVLENPHVAFVVDEYGEDWGRLWYLLVFGTARVVEPASANHTHAVTSLRRKYPQYRAMHLEDRPVLRITPRHAAAWSARRRRFGGRPRARAPRSARGQAPGSSRSV